VQLFKSESPGDTADWLADMDRDSEEVVPRALVCGRLAACAPGERFQLERLGYFCVDPDSAPGRLVLNRTCTLRDAYARKKA
jgi:glutaminyl-tRNA synthetase